MKKYAFIFRQIKEICSKHYEDKACYVLESRAKCSEKTCPLLNGKEIK